MSDTQSNPADATGRPSGSGTLPASDTPMSLLMAWNTEISQFYLSRFQQYAVLPLRMASCHQPQDFEDLTRDFQQKLVEDYQDVAERLSKVAGAAEMSETADRASVLLQAQREAGTIIEQAKAQAEQILASARKTSESSREAPRELARKSA